MKFEEEEENEEFDEEEDFEDDEEQFEDDDEEENDFEDEEEGDEELDEDEMKKQLADIPFEQLANFKKTGVTPFKKRSAEEMKQMWKKPSAEKKAKSAPAEMSSKIPVSRFRTVVAAPIKAKSRDPRFDDLSGTFNEDLYRKSYNFIEQYKSAEMEEIKAKIQTETDPNEVEKLKRALSIMTERASAEKKRLELQKIRSDWKKKESQRVEKGKRPYYLKKADERKMAAVAKYNQLKDSNKLQSFLSKKMAKNAKKDHKFVPHQRRTPNHSFPE